MAKVKVIAGDVEKGDWHFSGSMGIASMYKPDPLSFFKQTTISFVSDCKAVELLDEDKVKKIAGTAGWGIAGGLLLGPLGAIGGMLLGGNKKEVAFAAYLNDGRKFMGITDGKSWQKISASKF
jgi:hypothetical protein